MSWFSGLEAIVRTDVPLRDHTWYRLGGPARWFCQPRDERELARLLARLRDAGIAWRVLGGGANVIIRDEGFSGAVIRLASGAFEAIRFEPEGVVVAGAGADLPRLVRATLDHGLVGLEALAGIPGTVGGAVRMNAGGRYGEIGRFVRLVRVMERDGTLVDRSASEVGFAYRDSQLAGCVILAATLSLRPGDAEAARRRHRAIWMEKYGSQPALAARTSGCVFKNPPGAAAGRLLDQAGLKGTRIGGAEISRRHANFIEAHDDATAADVLHLITLAKERVRAATGIELEPEVEIW